MLSGETAVGRFPVEAVSMLTKIALRTERNFPHAEFLHRQEPARRYLVEEAISRATCQTADELGARAIITSTQTGATARMVSRYRPRAPIIAATPDRTVARQLLVCWGVMPVEVAPTEDIDAMLKVTVEAALKTGLVRPGEIGVITAGLRPGVPGSTNLMKVHVME
ncbi:MAG: pyruvate kinase [Bacillota bacterium]|nr:pyruvate kinase [Bacillota bacterium]